MKKKSTWLIIIGLILILIPTIGHFHTVYIQNQQYNAYQEMLKTQNKINEIGDDFSDEDNSSNEYNTSNEDNHDIADLPIDADNQKETEETIKEQVKPNLPVIGKVIIDKIDVNMIFIDGITDIDLIYGAGHIPDTAYPGEIGNCAIPAHRGFSFGTYFYRLDEMEIGDMFDIEYMGTTYIYKIYDKLIVLPEDTYVLKQPKDKKIVTLITCDPPVTGTHRLIVVGELYDPDEESTDSETDIPDESVENSDKNNDNENLIDDSDEESDD